MPNLDTTPNAQGWPAYSMADQAPMESPMERFVKGLGALSGGKFGIVRSKQDVWREQHDTQSYVDKYLQHQEEGQVAKQEMSQGLPQAQTANRVATANLTTAQAQTGLQQWPTEANIRGQRLALTNPIVEDQQKRAGEGLKFEETHPWMSPEEQDKTEHILGFSHVGVSDTQSKRNAYIKDLPADQQQRVKTAFTEKSLGLPVGTLARGGGHFEDFDTPYNRIKAAGLQDEYEVKGDTYGYMIQPRPLSARINLQTMHIRATQLQHKADQLAKERFQLKTYHRGTQSDADKKARADALQQNTKDQQTVDDELKKMWSDNPDVRKAIEDANKAGNAARKLAQQQNEAVDIDQDREDANAAIESGASADEVKARFKERTGEDL